MLEPSVASSVAQTALQWFESSSICQKKLSQSEWTVLAAIVLQTCHGDGINTFRVLSAATGNKCLGRRDLNVDGLVVNDCHAEILARRAFLRYLYTEALAWQLQGQDEQFQTLSLFERHPDTGRLVPKSQYSLHLFITEAPCGDAAIYELRGEVVDDLVQQRTAKEVQDEGVQVERSALRLTGAKSRGKRARTCGAESDEGTPSDKRFAQVVGIARVKSGRSDLPLEKQTLSMSCSDKLAKWNTLGLQGTLLLQWFEPIILCSIIVSEDKLAKSVANQTEALERAVSTRLRERSAVEDPSTCETHVVSDTDVPLFSRRRTPDAAPSSLALNWTSRESYWTRASISTSDEKQASSGPSDAAKFDARFFNNSEFEFLMAATGFKQGAKKASKMDHRAMERVSSRLCKRNLLRAFYRVLAEQQDHDALLKSAKELEYLQLKLAVPLTASSHAKAFVPSTPPNDRRKQFFEAFKDWIGVPAAFKQFKL
ncbi:tRNA-specific adenosine deaminase 1 [Phytophthora boehmeriae]|uniref:tRNA-specific adenosine deaminase 1 n=1 Tax=Phytophthora boehmeriae TaxID=109152 RepID=A0A8T1X3K2_9STRA|nr:tRNA-specific adenosine deaminase 1 [Phytophthora boehmeriae]